MEINIEAIKTDLEGTETFKLWNKEIGLTFEDFSIYDLEKRITYKKGKEDIGNYYINVKDDDMEIHFDVSHDAARKSRLKRIGKTV